MKPEDLPLDELEAAEKEIKELEERIKAATEYVDFLEKFWGIDPRLAKNPLTQTAREKYLRSMSLEKEE